MLNELRVRYPDLSKPQRQAMDLLVRDLSKRKDLTEHAKRDLIEDRLALYRERNSKRTTQHDARNAVLRAKDEEGRYYLGCCLDCSHELWVDRPRPRVPLCAVCKRRRDRR